MSPRAAWRLEAERFEEVYDFVPGKIAWLAAGLPVEGSGPHHAVAGEVLHAKAPTCRFGHTTSEARRALDESGKAYCVVVNDESIILGRVRRRDLPDDEVPIAQVMQPGPATVRPIEELKPLVVRMRNAGVTSILVASDKGKLLGVVDRDIAETALKDPPVGEPLL